MAGSGRRRRLVAPAVGQMLPWLGFIYDDWREAYVLRGIGQRHGPVFKVRSKR